MHAAIFYKIIQSIPTFYAIDRAICYVSTMKLAERNENVFDRSTIAC